jgi:hypothetical protein
MSSIPSETTGQPDDFPAEKMSAAHMLVLVVGVLLLAGGAPGVFALTGSVPTSLVVLAAGVPLIVAGAAGLGKGLNAAGPMGTEVRSGKAGYPARLAGELDPLLSRGMWLVKWLLAIPHYVVLIVLWTAFLVVTIAAGLVILFTGRYPVSLFRFTVGVLRWNWRVGFYASGVLGTDQYPPFTLARTGYPATFDVDYPEKLSRWQVLVKSWLFALPHLFIVAAFTGGAWASSVGVAANGISLLGLLVFIAAVILLFTGVYRPGIFNLLMGLYRWMYRTIVYTALMRDDYPPFRLDQGPLDPPAHRTET